MNIWIEVSTVIAEVFLPWYFFSGMLGQSNRSAISKLTLGVIYAVLLSLLSLLVPASSIRSAIIIIITYLTAKAYFNKSWLTTLYPTVLFFFFAILADIICGAIMQFGGIPTDAIMGDGFGRLVYNITCKLVHLVSLYMVLALVRPGVNAQSVLKSFPLLSCQLLSIYICHQNYAIIIRENSPDFLYFETLSLLYINLVICAFVETLNRSFEREQESELARQQLETQKNYYLDILERQEETRSLWHDIKKYMTTMETLVANEDRDAAKACLTQLQSVFSDISNSVDTGNKLIDSIFTYGMKKAADNNVTLKLEIWVNSNLSFSSTDLFIIIGNTLDNAIEACSQIDDKKERVVSVWLYQKNHLLLYEISNPYNEKSSKKAGKIHGYGLKNVSACVEKNDGIINIEKSHSIFDVSIQLNLND